MTITETAYENSLSAPAGKSGKRLYLPQLDGLRFFAFLLVFLYHYLPAVTYFPDNRLVRALSIVQGHGWVGVDIFLTLSAFLIFTLLLAEHRRLGTIHIRQFYIRRALRIWPLYYPYVLIGFVIPCFSEPGYDLGEALHYHLAPALVFLLNFSGMQFPASVPFTLGHLWTISLEEQFYLFAPLAMFFFADASRRRIITAILILFALTVGARTYEMFTPPPWPAPWTSPLCRLDPVLVGAVLAYLYNRRPSLLTRRRGEWFAAAAIALFVLITCYPVLRTSIHTVWQLLASALGCGCLIVAVLGRGWLGRLFGWPPLAYLGKISFGLYVYHELCLRFAPDIVHGYGKHHTAGAWLLDLTAVLGLGRGGQQPVLLRLRAPFPETKAAFRADTVPAGLIKWLQLQRLQSPR